MGRGERALNAGLAAFGLAAAAVILGVTLADPDLWGHIRCGLDVLRDHAAPEVDPYAYTTGFQRWIDHEWLAEATFAAAWTLGGAAGIIALKALVNGAMLALLWRRFAALRIPAPRIAILLVLMCTPVLILFLVQVRAQIYTYLLFAALLLALRRAEDGRYGWLWAAPPIVAVWVNLHGGVLAGLGMLALWGAFHAAFHWHARWRIFWPSLAAAAATLLNPYGAELPFFLLHTATTPRPEIQDWQPLALMSLFGAGYVVALATLVLGLAWTRLPRRPAPLILCVIAALLPLLAVRHFPLFCIAAIVFAGDHVASAWDRLMAPRPGAAASAPAAPAAPALLSLASFAAAALVLGMAVARGTFTRIPQLGVYPQAAVALLRDSGVTGNLAVDFRWGEYAIWHLAPRIKVGMDGRRETVYSELAYRRYLDFCFGRHDWDALLRPKTTDMALVQRGEPTYNLLKLEPGWALVYQDESAALFADRGSPVAPALARAAAAFTPPPRKDDFP